MPINFTQLATLYYFGDLQYWKLPRMAADALEEGYDGPALRELAGLITLGSAIRAEDVRASLIDSAFSELAISAPISKDEARLVLATQSALKALSGQANVFNEAKHVRIHLCEPSEPPEPLKRIVNLSVGADNTPRSQWDRIEAQLKDAFGNFLKYRIFRLSDTFGAN